MKSTVIVIENICPLCVKFSTKYGQVDKTYNLLLRSILIKIHDGYFKRIEAKEPGFPLLDVNIYERLSIYKTCTECKKEIREIFDKQQAK